MITVGWLEAKAKLAKLLDRLEKARRRALVEEIRRWRVGKDRGAGPGTTIPELIRAGRKYQQ